LIKIAILKQATLKKRFKVWGKFEEIKVAGDDLLLLREARIIRRDSKITIDSSTQLANAVIIMMKPGNSVPISTAQTGEWREAKADRTHLQLMRLMECLAWDELKMVNLSDFCESNHRKFLELIKRSEIGGIKHSRFASSPLLEWSEVISSGDLLLYGWGAF